MKTKPYGDPIPCWECGAVAWYQGELSGLCSKCGAGDQHATIHHAPEFAVDALDPPPVACGLDQQSPASFQTAADPAEVTCVECQIALQAHTRH